MLYATTILDSIMLSFNETVLVLINGPNYSILYPLLLYRSFSSIPLSLNSQVVVHVFVSPIHVNVTELHCQGTTISVKAQLPLMVSMKAVNVIQMIAITQTIPW